MIVFLQLFIALLELIKVVVEKTEKVRIRAVEYKEQAIARKKRKKV